MNRVWTGSTFLMIPGAAMAHPGHLAEVAGHGHWVAGAAIGAAIIIGLWAGLKGRTSSEESGSASEQDDPETKPEST